jgi:IS30 family transposase
MQLTQAQLYAIEIYLQEGYKDAKIARKIGKSKSVVSRLFQKHPKDSFSAERVVSERFSTRSENTTNHTRIQL